LKREDDTKEDKKRLDVKDVLVPQTDLQPAPKPSWLGAPKILLRLSICPLCKKQLKKSESGPARWVGRSALYNADDSDIYPPVSLRCIARPTPRLISKRY
jgi:hypothetical protein